MKDIVDLALNTAMSEEGTREEGGPNRGTRVNQYLHSVGLGPGNPWCAAFVYWCIEQAALKKQDRNPFIKTGYCPYIAQWAKDSRILREEPTPGDVFLLYGQSPQGFRARHTGFVYGSRGGGFLCIEGNTNLAGSPEGIGVFKRVRTIQRPNQYRFVRWADLIEEDEAGLGPIYELYLNERKIADMPIRGGKALCPVKLWAQSLGFRLTWSANNQEITLNGKEVVTEPSVINGVGYAPIRDLVESAGLQIKVDGRRVIVSR